MFTAAPPRIVPTLPTTPGTSRLRRKTIVPSGRNSSGRPSTSTTRASLPVKSVALALVVFDAPESVTRSERAYVPGSSWRVSETASPRSCATKSALTKLTVSGVCFSSAPLTAATATGCSMSSGRPHVSTASRDRWPAEQDGEEMRRALGQPHPARRARVLGTAERHVDRRHVGGSGEGLEQGLDRLDRDPLLRLDRRRAEVRRRDDVGQAEQRVVRIGGLRIEHVERRARQALLGERGKERGAIHEAPARDVDQHGGGLHAGELVRAEQRLALADGRRVERDHVGIGEQLVEGHERHAHLARLLGRKERVVAEQARLEGPRPRRHARAHLAEAHDPDGLARELGADELRLVPLAGRHGGRGLGDAPQEREQHGERVLHRRDDVAGRRIEHQDSPRRGGRHVHVVHPDARAPNDRQLRRGREERLVHLRRAAHEQRIGVLQRGEQLLPRDAREVDDLVARLAQQVEPGGGNLLGDDDAAHAASFALSSSAARRASSEAMSTSPMCPMRNVDAFHLP